MSALFGAAVVLAFCLGAIAWAAGFQSAAKRLLGFALLAALFSVPLAMESGRLVDLVRPYVGVVIGVGFVLVVLWCVLLVLVSRSERAKPAARKPPRPTVRRRAEVREPTAWQRPVDTTDVQDNNDDMGLFR